MFISLKSFLPLFILFLPISTKELVFSAPSHGISFNFNCFYTVYIGESRKALKWLEKKNTATKRLLFFDGSYQRRRKAQPTSIARLDLHAFPIHALDRTSLQPQAQSLPCHQSPASPLELQTERSSTNTCAMSAAQIAQPRIPLQADLRRCGPRAIVWPLTPAKLETLSWHSFSVGQWKGG